LSHTENLWPWSELGLDNKPDDPKDLRRAYAKKLKSIDSDADVQAFERLRSAYDHARRLTGDKVGRKAITRSTQVQVFHQPVTQRSEPKTGSLTKIVQDDEVASRAKPNPETSPWAKKDFTDSQTVLDAAQKLISESNLNAEKWLPLINAPALSEPHISHQFQWMLQDFLRKSPVLRTRSALRVELFLAIDDRFGWVSDGIGFLRQFPNSFELQSKMSDDLRREEWRLKRNHEVFRTPKKMKVKPLPHWVWIITFVLWLVLLEG
jgi:hypothetical protein